MKKILSILFILVILGIFLTSCTSANSKDVNHEKIIVIEEKLLELENQVMELKNQPIENNQNDILLKISYIENELIALKDKIKMTNNEPLKEETSEDALEVTLFLTGIEDKEIKTTLQIKNGKNEMFSQYFVYFLQGHDVKQVVIPINGQATTKKNDDGTYFIEYQTLLPDIMGELIYVSVTELGTSRFAKAEIGVVFDDDI